LKFSPMDVTQNALLSRSVSEYSTMNK